jgi:hypothetical protein
VDGPPISIEDNPSISAFMRWYDIGDEDPLPPELSRDISKESGRVSYKHEEFQHAQQSTMHRKPDELVLFAFPFQRSRNRPR